MLPAVTDGRYRREGSGGGVEGWSQVRQLPRSRNGAIRQINDTATTPLHRAAVTWRPPGWLKL